MMTPTGYKYPHQDTIDCHCPDCAAYRARSSQLVVRHPSRPAPARGQLIELPAADETWVRTPAPLTSCPQIGDDVNVVQVFARYERQGYGPPQIVGMRTSSVGNGQWVWRVVECPWNYKRTSAPGES